LALASHRRHCSTRAASATRAASCASSRPTAGALPGSIPDHFSSGLGMVSPFLRATCSTKDPQQRLTLLTELIAGMIAIAIATAALSVVQTTSRRVGQRVMHDLRVACTATCSGCRWRSSRAHARARSSRGSPTTSAASTTSPRTRDDDRPERDDCHRDDRRDGDLQLAVGADLVRPDAAVHLDDAPRRARAARDHLAPAGRPRRHLRARRRVAVGPG